jgi:hypothetical protein
MEKNRMKNINRRAWFVHLIIVVICIMITRLSDNSKYVYDDNHEYISKRIIVENLITRVDERHRARQFPGDLTIIIDECGSHSSKTTLCYSCISQRS